MQQAANTQEALRLYSNNLYVRSYSVRGVARYYGLIVNAKSLLQICIGRHPSMCTQLIETKTREFSAKFLNVHPFTQIAHFGVFDEVEPRNPFHRCWRGLARRDHGRPNLGFHCQLF